MAVVAFCIFYHDLELEKQVSEVNTKVVTFPLTPLRRKDPGPCLLVKSPPVDLGESPLTFFPDMLL